MVLIWNSACDQLRLKIDLKCYLFSNLTKVYVTFHI
jgi:hypothetical protein